VGIAPYVVINANMRRLDFFGNLFAMTRFITLRTEKHAQDEIRYIAHRLDDAYQEINDLIPGFKVNRQLD
jgi:thymidylate synthase ThyX